MKHLLIFLLAASCMACTNTGTVNILITNARNADCNNTAVTVPMQEIKQRLNATDTDTLILLNETNRPVEYNYVQNREAISFIVPVIKKNSQKNYTINRGEKRLSDNLFRFRTASITVTVH